MIERLDPVGCGCTDCLTAEGFSKSLDNATEAELLLAAAGHIDNATGVKIVLRGVVVP